MFREQFFFPALTPRLRQPMIDSRQLRATIKRTESGVRIRFSDGRIAWLEKEDHVAEDIFLASVKQWVMRQGVSPVELEFE